MTGLLFLSRIETLPRPYSRERLEHGLEEWRDRAAASGDPALDEFARRLSAHPAGRDFLAAIFGNSPFLSACLLRNVPFARDLFETGPERLRDRTLDSVRAVRGAGRDALMTALRDAREKMALLVAAADVAGAWSLDDVTGALGDFADAAAGAAVDHLLAAAAGAGDLDLRDAERPSEESGFTIIGMGKLGARELNYSSDVDLIALFDEERVRYTGGKSARDLFVRLTRDLIHLLQSRTSAGYVFRTDLRLRPDTGSSPLAMSTAAAESYYESVGQNWERAALIKARPVAGDVAAGRAFMSRISPFIWRKYLDFAAIQDVHSIKRQIHAHHGHGSVTVPGHDIKVGRGGIREIEFFAQTQQLIAGGRDPALRVPDTRGALKALAAGGRIERDVADDMARAYAYLRRLEHRLQMIADEQTHTVPETEEGLAHVAAFMGFPDTASFVAETLDTLRTVERHFARLFEHAPALGDAGSLVFTGTEDDPETVSTLAGLGYGEPSTAAALIRRWHHGGYRATRSARARELLTELTPAFLRAFAGAANPDAAILKFDEFLSKLPTGVQIFSLFHANPDLLDLMAEIMGSAPRLAEHLARNPRLMDNVLSGGFYDPLPGADPLARDLSRMLADCRHYEEVLDGSRRWGHDQAFQAGVHILRNVASAADVGPGLADVADVLLRELYAATHAEFARVHGDVRDGAFAIVALGKYGARELTPESDLDLAFVYDCPGAGKSSGGARPLAVGQYYSRLGKRVINAISAPTAEGRLYEVDMRLRPFGAGGPIAAHVDGFEEYQKGQAWTWEHMALTRARVVLAPPALRDRIEEIIDAVVRLRRDPAKLLRDVAEMYERTEREHGTEDPWRIKHAHGGLFELEFLCQYLILRHAADHAEVAAGGASDAVRALRRARVIDGGLADELTEALRLFRNVQGFLRQTLQVDFVEEQAPEGLRRALARATGRESFEALKSAILDTERRIHRRLREFIVDPARAETAAEPGGAAD